MLRASLRSLLQHKLRLVLTVVAIVAGIGFVAGTYVFTDSLRRAFDQLFDVSQPDVTVSFRTDTAGGEPAAAGPAGTLPGRLVAEVAAVPGVAAAYGVVRDNGAVVVSSRGEPVGSPGQPSTGISWVPDAGLQNLTLESGRPPAGPREVALLDTTAAAAGVGIGDDVHLDAPSGPAELTVVGIVDRPIAGADGGTLAVFDLTTAQRLLLDGASTVSSIIVRAEPGVSQQTVAERIDRVLPQDAETRTGQQRSADLAKRLQDAFTFVNTFLLAFAFIALFVACFLIYNTFTMLVAQRTRELALLRAVGASRGQVRRSVLVEAAAVGLAAAVLGLGAGVGMAALLRVLLAAFGVALPSGPLVVAPRTAAVALVVGVAVTVVSAYLPAARASRIPPVAAMREEVTLPARSSRVRTVLGIVLAVAAVVTARLTLANADDVTVAASYAGVSALAALVGLLALAPVVARGALKVIGAPVASRPVGRLARENGRRNPRRTAATAGALAIGLALMSAVSVIAASTKASVDEVIDNTVGADFILVSTTFQPFSPQVYQQVRDTPGAAVVTFSRAIGLQLAGERYPVVGVQPAAFARVFDITMAQGAYADLSLGGALVDEQTAARAGLRVGDTARVTFLNGPGTLRIDGIYQASGAAQGFVVSLPTLAAAGSLERDTAVYVRLAAGSSPDAVRAELEHRVAGTPSIQVVDRTQLKDQIDSQFDRVFGFVYTLLALAVIVAFLGIVNTLALSVHERRREIGLLRAVGTSRRQVSAMVILESVLIAILGGLVGIAIGVAYGALLQKALSSQGVSTLAVPYGQLGWFVLAAVAGGFVAALWPATSAARMNVLRAIASE